MNNRKTRVVPFSATLSLLFGGILNQLGWFFFGFGMIFAWIFVGNADFSFIYFIGNKTVQVEAKVVDCRETGAEINDREVYENHYKFFTPDGLEHEDFSYSTGIELNPGANVTVEYPSGKPEMSRIKGMRRQQFGLLVLFVLIFPLIGLIIVFFAFRSGVRIYRVLRNGIVTRGKLIDKQRTNATINDEIVYKFTFSFTDENGNKHSISNKTHRTDLLEDDREEQLIYNPDNPSQAYMIDIISGKLKINEAGDIEGASLLSAILALIIPFITIFGNGWYFLHLIGVI